MTNIKILDVLLILMYWNTIIAKISVIFLSFIIIGHTNIIE